ncbi:nucleoprotein TPR-like [Lineus longissimus]|uniref:nucleoprotein TPR-like n=1 Tax=Lineus longissimus TaxID=88925 RepID=UPI00315CF4F6
MSFESNADLTPEGLSRELNSPSVSSQASMLSDNGESGDIPADQAWYGHFQGELSNLPKDSYVERLLELTGENTVQIDLFRSWLSDKAKAARPDDCPTSEPIKRKSTKGGGTKHVKNANDCYLLQSFLDGATVHDIYEVYRSHSRGSTPADINRRQLILDQAIRHVRIAPANSCATSVDVHEQGVEVETDQETSNIRITANTNPVHGPKLLSMADICACVCRLENDMASFKNTHSDPALELEQYKELNKAVSHDFNANKVKLAELTATVSRLDAENGNLQAQVTNLHREKDEKDHATLNDPITDIVALKESVGSFETELNRIRDKVTDSQEPDKISNRGKTFVKQTKSDIASVLARMEACEAAYEGLQAALKEHQQEYSSLKAECHKLQRDLSDTRSELSDASRKREALAKDNERLRGKCETFENLPKEFKEVKIAFERIKDTRDSGVAKLRNDVKQVKTDVKNTETILNELDSKFKDLRKGLDAVKSKASDTERKVANELKSQKDSYATRTRNEQHKDASAQTVAGNQPSTRVKGTQPLGDASAVHHSERAALARRAEQGILPPQQVERMGAQPQHIERMITPTTQQTERAVPPPKQIETVVFSNQCMVKNRPNPDIDSGVDSYRTNEQGCGEFTGVTRKPRRRRAPLFVGFISPRTTVDSILRFLVGHKVIEPHVRLMKSKIRGTQSAKVIVDLQDKDMLLHEDFWPAGVLCREWMD